MFNLLPRGLVYIGLAFIALAGSAAALWTQSISVSSASYGSVRSVHDVQSDNVLRVSISTNDIVFNPADQMLYATRPSRVGGDGNSLTRINPLTGEVGPSVYVGSEPNRIAISDDGQTIYISLDGAYSIRRYNTATQTPGIAFPIGRETNETFGPRPPFIAREIAVPPGNPNRVAVARQMPGWSPGGMGTVIFDNGVPLPAIGPGHSQTPSHLAFSSSASVLYGGTYDSGLRTLSVGADGATDVSGSGTSFSTGKIKYENGFIFDGMGHVIDAETRRLLGTCVGNTHYPNYISTTSFVPDTATRRVLYAIKNGGVITIKAFSIDTYLEIGSMTIPDVGFDNFPTALVRYGTNGLAMQTTDNELYLIQTSLIPTANPLPMPTATPAAPAASPTPHSRFMRQLAVRNRDLIYRPSDGRFYASVPNVTGDPLANRLVRIDPSTATIENSFSLGTDPGRLAFSADGQILYAGIDGEHAVKKFDMRTQAGILQFPLGVGANGPKTAFDIEVLPNDDDAAAVSYGSGSYSYDGVDIFDNGVKRAQKADRSGEITMVSPDSLLIGESDLSRYGISGTGLVPLERFAGSGGGGPVVVGNRLYTTGGAVIDLTTKDIVGSFSGIGYWSGLTIDEANNRIFFLSNNGGGEPSGVTIRAYRLDNFLPVGSIPLPGIFTGQPARRFFRWGENGLAFTDFQEKIYFLQSDLVSTAAAVPVSLGLSAQNREVSENVGSFSVTVTRIGGLTRASRVDYSTVSGSAVAGTDFAAATGTLVFEPGEASKTIVIPVLDDNVYELRETRRFRFVLSNPTGGDIEIQGQSAVDFAVTDDDNQPSISPSSSNVSLNEPPSGTISAVFTVALSNPSVQAVTVDYATANGSATAGADYVAANGTLTFAPMETTKTVSVEVLADENYLEPTEFFLLNFSSVVNASANNFAAAASIINYNPNPVPTPTPIPSPTRTPTPTPAPSATPTPAATPTPTPAPTPSPTPYATPVFIRRVDLPLNGMVFSRLDNAIYASVPSRAGTDLGNSITRIDAVTGQIGPSVFVGSEPNEMAVSENGQAIYVKLSGAKSVRRFDVPTRTASMQFGLIGQSIYADILAVQPGNLNVLVAAGNGAMAVYDDGAPRPVAGEGSASFTSLESIAFDGPASLYAGEYNGLYKFTFSASGVQGVLVRSGNNFGTQIEIADGRIFVQGGRVYDRGGILVGTFQNAGFGVMALDHLGGRAFFLDGSVLKAFDLNTYALIGSVNLSGLVYPAGGKLVRWGENGLAIRGEDRIYLIQSPLISANGALPTGIQLSSTSYSRTKSGSLPVTVVRTGSLNGTSSVDFTTVDGSAVAGSDYSPTAGTLTFAPGEASKTINVPLISDNVYEGNETLRLVLSAPSGAFAEILSPGTAELTINDNDGIPIVTALNISANEPAVGTLAVVYTVQLSNPSVQAASVRFATSDGTATAGRDYVVASGTLAYAPLETTKTIVVFVLADGDHGEPSETFRINFSDAANSVVGFPQRTVTINNHVPAMVSLSGRVLTPNGTTVRNARVSLIDAYGNSRTATTSSFGVYSFANVAAGVPAYTMTVGSKRFRFAPQSILVETNVTGVDFVGLE
jgi:hypothetical protein